MALKGVKGPDRVLYALSALLQNKLPAAIAQYNNTHKALTLFTIAGDSITFTDDFLFKYQTGNTTEQISFPKGSYGLEDILTIINNANQSLTASKYNDYSLLLSSASSIKFLTAFGNLRENQQMNYVPLQNINSYIMNGVLPDESQTKAFPSMVIELASIAPSPDDIMVAYSVNLTVAVTSAINTSQVDYLSNQLFKYYDCIHEVLTVVDDGSLGGITNGLNIMSADIGEATGNSYFLKYLTIALEISAEED